MGTLDWVVIGIFFLALIGIIVWVVKQKQNDSADYFLGGRDATWLAIGASIFARSEERRVGKECRSRWSPYH